MESLAFATIQQLKTGYATGAFTPNDVLQDCLNRFKTYDKKLGTALEIFEQRSIVECSNTTGSLAGIPGIIKDNICQKERITSCASKILANYRAPYDATAIGRLKKEGALLVGRANCDEFAMGSSTETSAFQKTFNPWDLSKVPGGSSGGSIAAVAAGLVPWSLGTETGGSVRQPAALCGIVGLKPTYGLISRYGVVAYASSLDQIGIASRTVKDTAAVLEVIAGHDAADATSLGVSAQSYTAALTGKIPEGLTVGIITNAVYAPGVDKAMISAVEDSIKVLRELGATIKEISIPSMDYGAAVYFIISRAEAASNLARFDGVRYGVRADDVTTLADLYQKSRAEGFGSEVKARIIIGNYVLSAGHSKEFYLNALKVQQLMRFEFQQAFKEVDVVLTPTAPSTAFSFDAFADDKLQMDLQDYFTCAANLVGIPAISIPCGFSNNLPLGLQLMGPHLSEDRLLQVAHAYEQRTEWHKHTPQAFL